MLPVLPLLGGVLLATALTVWDRPPRPRRRRMRKTVKGPRRHPAEVKTQRDGTIVAAGGRAAAANTDDDLGRDLTLSLSGLAVATGATLVAAPYAWLAVPLLAVPLLPFLKDGYRALVQERRLKMAVVDCLLLAGLAALGQWIPLGVGVTMLSVA